MRARYYNPEIKRFINQDVLLGGIGDSTSLNRYSYVNGNPVSYIDPFGLEAQGVSYLGVEKEIAGFIPFVGNAISVYDSVTAFSQGDIKGGIINAVYAVPGLGNVARVGRLGVKASKVSKSELVWSTLSNPGTKSLLRGEGKVGRYKELSNLGRPGDNITAHHLPSSAKMKKGGVKHNDGLSINMEQPTPGSGGRHRRTYTYGRSGKAIEQYMDLSYRDALAIDVKDARKIFREDGVYDQIVHDGLKEVIRRSKGEQHGLFNK